MAALNEKELQHLDKQTLIALLINSNTALNALQKQVDGLNENINLLTEEIRGLRAGRFGRSSEKGIVDSAEAVQISFAFNECEITLDLNPNTPEPSMQEIHPKPYTRGKKSKGRRAEEIKDCPRTVVEHKLTDKQLQQLFPDGKWKQLPDEVYEKLHYNPASFEVVEHRVAVYAGNGEKSIVRADRPAELLNNSIASASLVAALANYKFINSQPINRLAEEFNRLGVCIPRQTLCRWLILCSDRYISRLYNRLREQLLRSHVIHADETPVGVNRDGRPAGSKSYMWVYRSGAYEEKSAVIYEYQKTRKKEYPKAFLATFHGYCVTDGYAVYHSIEKEQENLIIAGCWAHARRGFADVVKALSKDQKNDDKYRESTAYKALKLIQTMYHYESACANLSPEERFKERQRTIAPLVDAFFAYLKSEIPHLARGSKTGAAVSYCLNQEKYLRVFLEDPEIPMDNNSAERSIRTFCLGKRNWFIIDTERGAQSSAIWYSIAETAKANSLRPYEYFKYLLEELPKHGEFEDRAYLDDLLPWSDKLPESCLKKTT